MKDLYLHVEFILYFGFGISFILFSLNIAESKTY